MSDVVLGTMSTGMSKKPMAPALIVFTLVRTATTKQVLTQFH